MLNLYIDNVIYFEKTISFCLLKPKTMKTKLFTVLFLLFASSLFAQEIKLELSTKKAPDFNISHKSVSKKLLFQQDVGTAGWASQEFEEANEQYTCQSADDFDVIMGPWTIEAVSVFGSYSAAGNLEFVHIYFYENNAGIPGDLIKEFLNVPCVSDTKSGYVYADLPENVVLDNGKYWVSVVAKMDFTPYGQWYWWNATTNNGLMWKWRNPNGGFGHGSNWIDSQTVFGVGAGNDLSLSLFGAAPNLILARCINFYGQSGHYYLGHNAWKDVVSNNINALGAIEVDGVMYALNSSRQFGSFNASLTTWTMIGETGITAPNFVFSLAYDPVEKVIYTVGLTGTYPNFEFSLYSINKTTGEGTLIGTDENTGTIMAIAADNAGNLYGVRHHPTENAEFIAINKNNASGTVVGDMGGVITSQFPALAFSLYDNSCYFKAMGTPPDFLYGSYKIDVTTGATTQIGEETISAQITGFSIPYIGELFKVNYNVYGSNGSIKGKVNNNPFASGSVFVEGINVTFSAFPSSGYKVKVWAVNGIQQAGSSNIFVYENLDKDIIVTVEFMPSTTDIDEIENNIAVYPSPFRDELLFSNPSLIKSVQIINVLGVKVIETNLTNEVIKTSGLPAGVYFVVIETIDGQKVTHKVIKN